MNYAICSNMDEPRDHLCNRNILRHRKQTYENKLQQSWERGKLGIWDQQTTLNKIDKQQGFTVQHRDFYSIFCNTLSWKRI